MRGPGSYGIGTQIPFGGSSEDKPESSSPLDTIRQHTSKIEDMLDTLSEPIKPYAFQIGSLSLAFLALLIASPATCQQLAAFSSS